MRIEIAYQRYSDAKPQTLVLAPDVYFDPLEPNESFEENGIPKYNHAVDYLPYRPEEIHWTEVRITEIPNSYSIRTEFYRNASSMWHRKEAAGYEEICVQTQISDKECHIVRLHKDAVGNWKVNYSGKITGETGEPQKEAKYIVAG